MSFIQSSLKGRFVLGHLYGYHTIQPLVNYSDFKWDLQPLALEMEIS